MKQWNAHSWYITGILLALLVGVLSVEWSSVARLPEILSFAVGFSSLLLAIFTIIQSMTSTGDASAALASVREAASGIRDTAGEVKSAAADVRTIASGLLESSEANRLAISELATDLKSKSQSSEPSSKGVPAKLSLGSGPAFLAALLSHKTKKPIKFAEIFPQDASVTYEHGTIGGLTAAGIIDYSFSDDTFTITSVNGDEDKLITAIKSHKFQDTVKQESFLRRIKAVEDYFQVIEK